MVISPHAKRTQIGYKRGFPPRHGEGAGGKEDLLIPDRSRRYGSAVLFGIATYGYRIGVTQVGKRLKVSIQSVLRGVDRGGEDFQDRGWRLKDFIK